MARLGTGTTLGSVSTLVLIAPFLFAVGLVSCRTPPEAKVPHQTTRDAATASDALREGDSGTVQPAPAPAPASSSSAVPADEDVDSQSESSQVAAEEEPSKEVEDPVVPMLKLLRDRAEEHLLWVRELLASGDELTQERQSLTEDMARLGVMASIPEVHDDAQVEAEWRGLAQVMQFQIESWMISKSEFDQPPLPAEMPADKELKLASADVRSVYQVVAKVPAMSDEQLVRLLEGIAGFQRLTLVRRIKLEVGGKLTINAEVYLFNPTSRPKFVVPERTVEAAMAELGIHLTLSEAVRKDPIGFVQTATLAYREYEASRKKAQQLAELQGDVLWLRERMAFWKSKSKQRQAVTLERAKQGRTVGGP